MELPEELEFQNTVHHTISNLKNAESVNRKIGSGKQCQIKANNARSLVNLANNNPRLYKEVN